MLVPSRFLLLLSLLIAPAWAQTPAAKPKAAPNASPQSCGRLTDNVLKCPRFGFTYKVAFGWVDRTDDMQPETDSDMQESGEAAKPEAGQTAKSETLLAVFERPPGAPADSINSAVVIAAESLSNYHGIKTAADYFGPITELAEQDGFKVINEPHEFPVGTKQLVRGDFSKERGKLTMWQSSLVMIEKGYIVSFTFVGGSEDELDELIGSLSFGARSRR
jgi:hypothetical protein